MSGYVYAIGIEATTHVKIGRARSPERRMAALQTSMPFKLELLYSLEVEHPAAVERALHDMLAHLSMRGEWFEIPETPFAKLFERAVEASERAIQQAKMKGIEKKPRQEADPSSFAWRLREAMKANDWNQMKLAERSGMHYQQIHKLLAGKRADPCLSTVVCLADAMSVTTDYLAGRELQSVITDGREAGK